MMAEYYGLLGHLNKMETLLMLLVTPVFLKKGLLSSVLAAAHQKSHDPDCIIPVAAVFELQPLRKSCLVQ